MATKAFFDGDFKCHFCPKCLGRGCIGQLPGMGGVNQNKTFILNCSEWDNVQFCAPQFVSPEDLGIAPVTGAIQNIGFANESDFYLNYFKAAKEVGISICVGDGAPDEKLELGIKAVQTLGEKAFYFFKPYPDDRIFERIDWTKSTALAVGMDIDAYNIVTMRNQAKLERKSAAQIKKLRNYAGLPFMLKGIFSKEDVELCKEVKPDIVVVSNHGGRVETIEKSTAEFLSQYAETLKDCTGEIWVDGGIRKSRDIMAAKSLGAKKCLVARPWISALVRGGITEMSKSICELFCSANE